MKQIQKLFNKKGLLITPIAIIVPIMVVTTVIILFYLRYRGYIQF